ncbi:hypothetical protein J7S78_13790 [Klebsiella oxytoca]|uniref:Uncharacterized protein n=1 Tax=Klebsiella oxytoca TaxID=571 RepID=A0AAP2FJP1_KLEOX|nr:hypothetical protein [Klebsiella oxytoca]MBQ0600865.1 hypothetical protein [Klebsiella oxytoca]
MRVTINNINTALKNAGIDGEILKGQDYYYFSGSDFDLTEEQGVYGVFRLGELSIERWVEEAKEKITK